MNARHSLIALAAGAAGACAFAQVPSLEAAQTRYAREVAACNNAGLPAPQREACVRAAGVELDRVRASQPMPPPTQALPRVTPLPETSTQDGRATVIRQSSSALQPEPPSATPPETRTTQDGRATVVVPTDSTLLRPGPN